jgi:N-acetylneuraminic acid mutarotase
MKKALVISLMIILHQYIYSQPNSWTQKASLPGPSRLAAMNFATGQYGYVCSGNDSNNFPLNDNWIYDPMLDSWTQKSNLTFALRAGGISFTVGAKSYCGFGFLASGNTANDVWEYDNANDSWAQKSSCPGSPRALTNSFVIADKAYITCGSIDVSNITLLHDCWEYDPQNNTWSAKSDLPGITRVWPVSFVIDGEAYVGTGSDSMENSLNDFYKYNSVTNTWTQLSNTPNPRTGAIGCVLNNTGYIGLGDDGNSDLNDLFYYEKSTDTWHQAASLPAAGRDAMYMFVIDDKLYVGGGEDQNWNNMRDLWEYTPDSMLTRIENSIVINDVVVSIDNSTLRVQMDEKIHLPARVNIYSVTGLKLFSATINETVENFAFVSTNFEKCVYYVEDRDKARYSGAVVNTIR